jgi:predicted alpha/beta hydrolase
MDAVSETSVTIDQPGAPLAGRLFLPLGKAPREAVQISAATGVPAGYYAGFARWLAGRGHAVLTFDYSHTDAPRRARVTMSDWGVRDVTAARLWLAGRFPGLPMLAIGHSLGGLCLPFQGGLDLVSRAICVAAGPVHLSDHPWRDWLGIASTWHGHGPALTAALGYLPGRRMGLGADIPGPVYWQWRRWCSRRGSCRADPLMPPFQGDSLAAPVTLVAFSDDGLVPPAAVWRLAEWLPRASVERRLISGVDHGLARIGHIAAFAPRNAAVWPALVQVGS